MNKQNNSKAISLRYRDSDWYEIKKWMDMPIHRSPTKITAFLKYLIQRGLEAHQKDLEFEKKFREMMA